MVEFGRARFSGGRGIGEGFGEGIEGVAPDAERGIEADNWISVARGLWQAIVANAQTGASDDQRDRGGAGFYQGSGVGA